MYAIDNPQTQIGYEDWLSIHLPNLLQNSAGEYMVLPTLDHYLFEGGSEWMSIMLETPSLEERLRSECNYVPSSDFFVKEMDRFKDFLINIHCSVHLSNQPHLSFC